MAGSREPEFLAGYMELKSQLVSLDKNLASYVANIEGQLETKRKNFQVTITQLGDEQKKLKELIEQNELIESNYKSLLSTNLQKRDDALERLKQLKIQREEATKQRAELEDQLRELEADYIKKKKEINDKDDFVNEQVVLNNDKMVLFERLLGMKIDVVSSDILKFTFDNLDPYDFKKEASFSYDTYKSKVVECDPKVSEDVLQNIQAEYVRTKNIGYFWRDMRKTLKDQLLSDTE